MPINKSEKGKKRVCENCSCRWYDLNKSPIICPVCKQEFEINDLIQSYVPIKNKDDTNEKIDDLQIDEDSSDTENSNDDIISLEEVEEEKN
jgi:uncharacterized protein (TIGR02300 family)